MSDGRSFAQSNESLTVDQKLEALERKIPVYLEKISVCDELVNLVQNLTKALDSVNNAYSMIQSQIIDLKKDILQSQVGQEVKLKNYQTDFIQHQEKTDVLKDTVKNLSKSVEDKTAHFDQKIEAFKDNSFKQFMQCVSKDDFESLKMYIANIEDEIKKKALLSLQNFENLKDYVGKFVSQTMQLNEDFKNLSKNKDEIKSTVNSVVTNNRYLKTDIDLLRDNIIPAVKKEFILCINNLKTDLKNSNTCTCSQFEKKLDSVALDGSNAVLRASNNEKHVDLLKKQIENIYLLLKKHELSQ